MLCLFLVHISGKYQDNEFFKKENFSFSIDECKLLLCLMEFCLLKYLSTIPAPNIRVIC